jgi:catabolite regulation protein CreA
VGWNGYVARVIAAINLQASKEHVFVEFLERRQKRKMYWKIRQEITAVRIRRKIALNNKIKKQKVDDDRAISSGVTYFTGMAMNAVIDGTLDEVAGQTSDATGAATSNENVAKKNWFCKSCKQHGHSMRTSKKCLFYKARSLAKTDGAT